MNDASNNDFATSDFRTGELKLISDTLAERFGKEVETQCADIELRLYKGAPELKKSCAEEAAS